MQYTVRDIPRDVDRALRAKAKAEKKSLNSALLEVVKRGLGLDNSGKPKRDLSFMHSDPADTKAIAEAHEWFDRVDEEMWR